MMYNKKQEPMSIFPCSIQKMLGYKNSVDIIALFNFYYYTSKYQNTSSIKCTTGFVMKGLNISKDRVRKAKASLIELGFIQEIQVRKDDGSFGERYIVLHLHRPDYRTTDFAPDGNTTTNALSNKKNALSNKKKEKDIYININTQKECEINIPFDQVWDAYDRKEGRHMAETKWLKLSDKERSLVAECIPKYVADNPNKKYRKHFATFLNQKTWKDYESSNKANEQRDKTISILLDKLQSGEFNRRDCGEYIRQEGHSIDDELYIKHKLIELGYFKEDA